MLADIAINSFIVFLGLVSWITLGVIVVYLLAKVQTVFTFVPEGQIMFINKGENLYDIVANVDGHVLDKNGMLRKQTEEERSRSGSRGQPLSDHTARPENQTSWIRNLLWDTLGIYVIGIPGYFQVKSFKIKGARLQNHQLQNQNDSAESYIEAKDNDREVTTLRWRFQRPVGVNSVELGGDGSYISAIIMCVFEVVIPQRPVYELAGDFFELLESAVRHSFENFCSTARFKGDKEVSVSTKGGEKLTYRKFLSLDKKHGSRISEAILSINNRVPSGKKGGAEEFKKKGIEEVVGIKIIEAYIFEWTAVGKTRELADAQQDMEIATAKARGVIAKSEGDAKAIETVAQAEGNRFQKLVSSLIDKGVDPNIAAQTVSTFLETENLKNAPSLQTLVQRGGGALPTIPTKS